MMTVICETNKRSVIVLTPTDERLTGAVIQGMRAVINCNNLEHVIIDFTAIWYLMGGSAGQAVSRCAPIFTFPGETE